MLRVSNALGAQKRVSCSCFLLQLFFYFRLQTSTHLVFPEEHIVVLDTDFLTSATLHIGNRVVLGCTTGNLLFNPFRLCTIECDIVGVLEALGGHINFRHAGELKVRGLLSLNGLAPDQIQLTYVTKQLDSRDGSKLPSHN